MDDLISRQAAIDALHMHLMYRMGTDSNKNGLMIGLTVCRPHSLNALVLIVAGQQTTVDGMQMGEQDAR